MPTRPLILIDRKPPSTITKRWRTHYDTLGANGSHPRGSCDDPEDCDCECSHCMARYRRWLFSDDGDATP